MSQRTSPKTPHKLVIATRESPLAMWQAQTVQAALMSAHAGLEVQLLGMTSRGDQLLDVPLAKVGGKGLFVKELESALLDGSADIAVHSMKDVPMEFPDGLGLGAICQREDPTDAFVSNRYGSLDELPAGAVVGTSSLRRECQVRARRPDLQVRSLRGIGDAFNVPLSLSLYQKPHGTQGLQRFPVSRQPLQRDRVRPNQKKRARIALRQALYDLGVGLTTTYITWKQTG